jgi:hypothetical protein
MANKNNSPQNASRGCLCKDGTYSKECCEGELANQGIGALVSQNTSTVVNTNQPRVITRENA